MNNTKIAIIGLGYVGLPLAIEFGKKYDTIGYDLDEKRVDALLDGKDTTLEVKEQDLKNAKFLTITNDQNHLKSCNYFIVTVPTPILENHDPDLSYLQNASRLVGKNLSLDSVVIYESTVFPGCTEEICVPILEKISGLIHNIDFFTGYSPERINPGDKDRRVTDIKKLTSGSNAYAATRVDALYSSIITAGTHKCDSIKIAEAAKVIENVQRDINIALMNELSQIFSLIDIDTVSVINAASTKWNFQKFSPGLVGGHCIGIDPYYLAYKAKQVGYYPDIILAGRKTNENMIEFSIRRLKDALAQKGKILNECKILFLGLTFKENCPDFRNSKSIEFAKILEKEAKTVHLHDPYGDHVNESMNLALVQWEDIPVNNYDVILITVSHIDYIKKGLENIKVFGTNDCIVFDLKSTFPDDQVELRL